MKGLTLWNRNHFIGALVPTESVFWVRHLWSWLGGALVWSEAGHWMLNDLSENFNKEIGNIKRQIA